MLVRRARVGQPSEHQIGAAGNPLTDQDRRAPTGAMAEVQNLLRIADHNRRFGVAEVIHLKAVQHRQQQVRVAEFQAQLARTHERRVTLVAGRADLIDQAAPQRHLQRQLLPARLGRSGRPSSRPMPRRRWLTISASAQRAIARSAALR